MQKVLTEKGGYHGAGRTQAMEHFKAYRPFEQWYLKEEALMDGEPIQQKECE